MRMSARPDSFLSLDVLSNKILSTQIRIRGRLTAHIFDTSPVRTNRAPHVTRILGQRVEDVYYTYVYLFLKLVSSAMIPRE